MSDTNDLDAFEQELFGVTEASDTPKESVKDASEAETEEPENTEVDTEVKGEDETPTEADDLAEDEEASEEKPDEVEPKKKNRFQDRIDTLTEKARTAERERDALIARIEALEKPVKPEPAVTPDKEDAFPDPEAFNEDGTEKYPMGEIDPKYISDLHAYAAKEAQAAVQKEADARQAGQSAQAELAAMQAEWEGRVEAAKDTYEDYTDKEDTLSDIFRTLEPQYAQYLAKTLVAMDKGVDVSYHLGANPELAKEIISSGPLNATLALGRLEAKFATVKEPRASKAPTPPPSNKGTARVTPVKPDTDDLDAFEKQFFA